jgi:hypothetical protein
MGKTPTIKRVKNVAAAMKRHRQKPENIRRAKVKLAAQKMSSEEPWIMIPSIIKKDGNIITVNIILILMYY